MKQIRENIYEVTFTDLGQPKKKGYFNVEGLGKVMLDEADLRFLTEVSEKGFEPTWHVSRSAALKGAFVVVSRQWPA
jgi:hypothetical protein